jgi:hypothetical protein
MRASIVYLSTSHDTEATVQRPRIPSGAVLQQPASGGDLQPPAAPQGLTDTNHGIGGGRGIPHGRPSGLLLQERAWHLVSIGYHGEHARVGSAGGNGHAA